MDGGATHTPLSRKVFSIRRLGVTSPARCSRELAGAVVLSDYKDPGLWVAIASAMAIFALFGGGMWLMFL
jgi:hypothetical protein